MCFSVSFVFKMLFSTLYNVGSELLMVSIQNISNLIPPCRISPGPPSITTKGVQHFSADVRINTSSVSMVLHFLFVVFGETIFAYTVAYC